MKRRTTVNYSTLFWKIFPYASYTVLGDINQNINPYYKYNSLYDLKDILGDTKYVELNKTYRSSPEIIEYTNKIMGLKHAVSIRHSNNFPVICENPVDLYAQLKDDIKEGQKHHKRLP